MTTSNALPSRKQGKIVATICKTCFVAIPEDQVDTHAQWHADRSVITRKADA